MFSERCRDLLTGSYDCVDRIVLNAYFSMAHSPGGFRVWWRRWHGDSDEQLDNAHLMRLAGRFARRVRASAQAHGIPVIDCKAEERKHQIAEQYRAEHPVGTGVFLILVARAPATVWKVSRSGAGVLHHMQKTRQFVNHYSFHIIDPTWGHVTIKISGHPPFGAQVILNGHEYVACAGQKAGLGFAKEGNCFTRVSEPERLAQIADTLSGSGTIGRLRQVIDRWIYTACLCFGLGLDEQKQSGFVYDYSIYQVEYSRNLLFASGAVMDRLFNTLVDRTRSRLDVPKVRTLFGSKGRPHRKPGFELSPRQAVVIEKPQWNLTIFKVRFGLLTLKGYTKGERVLRFEAIVHNTRQLGCGRTLERFAHHPADRDGRPVHHHARLRRARLPARRHPRPATRPLPGRRNPGRRDQHEHTPVRAALAAALALAIAPQGFTAAQFTAQCGRRPDRPRRLQHPSGRLRPPQAARQTARHQTRPCPPLPRARRRRAHYHRAAHRPRQGHRPPPRRNPHTATRAATPELDPDRPRLRNHPPTHADPVQPPRHLIQAARRIDNILSIAPGKPLDRRELREVRLQPYARIKAPSFD